MVSHLPTSEFGSLFVQAVERVNRIENLIASFRAGDVDGEQFDVAGVICRTMSATADETTGMSNAPKLKASSRPAFPIGTTLGTARPSVRQPFGEIACIDFLACCRAWFVQKPLIGESRMVRNEAEQLLCERHRHLVVRWTATLEFRNVHTVPS